MMQDETMMKLIDKQTTVYLSSIDEDGFPHIRAMLAPRKRIGLHTFYLTTNTSSRKVAHYRKNPKACLYFCDKRFFRGVMLLGSIEVLEDSDSKEMIWQETDTMYYPKGVQDPDYCVLKFHAVRCKQYANFHTEIHTI